MSGRGCSGGGGGDYFVAEASTDATSAADPMEADEETGERPAFQMEGSTGDFEAEGVDGPNKYTYWVSTDPSGANSWTKLPHVTPKQVRLLPL